MDTKEKKTSPGTKRAARRTDSGGGSTTRRKKQTAAPAREAAKKRTAAAGRKVSRPTRTKVTAPAPDVVYTPAKPFSRERFLIRLATVVAVVIALMFGISIFFRVDHVTVSGPDKYTPYLI